MGFQLLLGRTAMMAWILFESWDSALGDECSIVTGHQFQEWSDVFLGVRLDAKALRITVSNRQSSTPYISHMRFISNTIPPCGIFTRHDRPTVFAVLLMKYYDTEESREHVSLDFSREFSSKSHGSEIYWRTRICIWHLMIAYERRRDWR